MWRTGGMITVKGKPDIIEEKLVLVPVLPQIPRSGLP